MKRIFLFSVFCFFISKLLLSPASGAVPAILNFQGYLSAPDGSPITAELPMTFTIYDALTGGSTLWAEPQTVMVSKGLYHVKLGEIHALSLPLGRPFFLGIQVDQDPEMVPRIPISPQAFAFRSGNVGTGGGWVDSGGVVSLATSTDRVGIGIPEPGEELHVRDVYGNAWLQGVFESTDSDGGLQLMSHDPATHLPYQYDLLSLPSGHFILYDAGNHWSVLGFDDQGNLGIGTPAPTSKLDVDGDVHARGRLVFTEANGTPYLDNWIGMAENIDRATKWLHIGGIRDGGVRRLALFGDFAYFNGFVGMGAGEVNPSERLQISGNIKLSGTGHGIGFPDGTRQVTSATQGSAGSPLPAFDSGWNPISPGQTFTLGHTLGNIESNVNKYMVDLQFKHTNGTYQGIHNMYYGGDSRRPFALPCGNGPSTNYGAYYSNLTTTSIKVYRQLDDTSIDQFRVRIWLTD
jgi:hypothetical protein